MGLRHTCIAAGLTVATLLAGANTTEAGPWVRAPGSTYSKLNMSFFTAEQSFNQGQATGLQYTGVTTNFYNEVGLPGQLQLITDLPFVMGRNNSPQGVNYLNNSFGDARVELGYGGLPTLLDFEGVPITFAVETKIPLYSTVLDADSDADFEGFDDTRANFPDAGDGNTDITPKVQVGYSLYPLPAWVTGELGYRSRLGGFSDGIFASLSTGFYAIEDHLALNIYSNAVVNIEDDPNPEIKATREFVYLQGSIFAKNDDWVPGLGLSVGAGWLPWSENSAAGNDISVGLSYEQ